MGKNKLNKKIFHSKFLVFSLIYSFLLLITSEATPNKVDLDSNKEFKPVVRVKEAGEEIPASQKDRFERLIEEGKKLFQEEMDPEGAIKKFKEAQALAITRAQKADVYFYLSLVYYATLEEKGPEEFDEAIRKLIEIDYYRELDKLLCPPKYRDLFQGIKKEYGALRIQSRPAGADVYLNDSNVPVGKTPLTIGSKAGSVKIRVKKGRKEKKEILKVISGKETTTPLYILKGGSSLILVIGGLALAGGAGAAFLLKAKPGEEGGAPSPATGSIQVNSSPTGARVYLDGTDTGETTNCTLTNISPGSHTVKLLKEGYEDYEDSVSVTAGQTTTVNANLTKHTITVTNPISSTFWIKGEEAGIEWQTSSSARFQKNVSTSAGLNTSKYPGRNLSPSSQRRALQSRRSFRNLIGTRRDTESMDSPRKIEINSSKATEISSNKSSKSQDVSKKSFSYSKKGNIIHQRAKNIRIIKRNNSFGMINLPISKGISPQTFTPSGKVRVLAITNVKIELYKADSLVTSIIENTENNGTYTWTEVDPSLEDGSDYKVRISCASDPEVYGESDEFNITYGYVFLTKWGSEGSGDGQFKYQKGIAVDSSGYVYVADDYNHRIQKFTSNGSFETKWGSYGSGDGQFMYTEGIAVDNSGYVYVADDYNHRIQKFTSNGSFETKWGSEGTGDGQFSHPKGIAVDSSGYVYVADRDNHRIQKFTSNGSFVTKWGSEGSGDGQFIYPEGIAVDNSGYVYVADTNNHRIQKFEPISGTGLSRNSPKLLNNNIINNNFDKNKNSVQKSSNMKFSLQNRLKNSKNQMNRKIRNNEERINKKDR